MKKTKLSMTNYLITLNLTDTFYHKIDDNPSEILMNMPVHQKLCSLVMHAAG